MGIISRRRGTLRRLREMASQRFGWGPFRRTVLERRVPETPWYQGDGAALTTLLLVQIVTGVTMTLYYSNAADHAYDSVVRITHEVTLGWLVRGLHYWSAGLMVVMLVVHVLRQVVLGGYKAPREGTWTVGVIQFFLVLAMAFTGYVLRWDERAVYAVRVLLNMLYDVPLIGHELVLLVQGGPQLGSLTLSRFYSVHVWLVPLLLIGVVGIHLYLVVIHGVTSKPEREQPVGSAAEQKQVYEAAAESAAEGEWFHPQTAFLTGVFGFLVFALAFVLALVRGAGQLYPEGNLVAASMPREEWWFWWFSAVIAQLPPVVAPAFYVLFPLALLAGMLLLPFIDRGPNRGARSRPVWVLVVLGCTIGVLWLTELRARSPWTGWPEPDPPPAPARVVLSDEADRGRLLFARYGCTSCHAVSGHGRRVGPDLARTQRFLSQSELESYILAPPEGVAMPSYRNRMSGEELALVARFVLVAQTFAREE